MSLPGFSVYLENLALFAVVILEISKMFFEKSNIISDKDSQDSFG